MVVVVLFLMICSLLTGILAHNIMSEENVNGVPLLMMLELVTVVLFIITLSQVAPKV